MRNVKVVYHREPDGWWAESPDVDGWSAAAPTLAELQALAEEGIRFALERDDVLVSHVLEHSPGMGSWVLFDFVADATAVGGPDLVDVPGVRVGPLQPA